MTARTCGVVVLGVEGHVIDVEVHISHGMVGTTIVGLPDTAVGESRDRARAAIQNSGCSWPERKITIGLSPASLHKRGPMLDLAIAVSVLAADGQVPAERIADLVCVGELALNGRVQPMTGTVVAALGAVRAGRRRLVVPRANVAEAQLVPELEVHGVSCLAELVAWLRDQPWEPDGESTSGAGSTLAAELIPGIDAPLDLVDVRGQSVARKALEIAAAGGHHLAMLGPPGVGKTLLAERLPGLLPELDRAAALEVTAIHSVAGRLPANSGLVTRAPFEAPH
ncbi:MAG: ATP-binding protein, partial [Actinobacteria bacterium]|nr:ATP-binding protein [Actinomycetota bacterium]